MTPALHWNPYVVPPQTVPEIGNPWSVWAVQIWSGAALATEAGNPETTATRREKATARTRFVGIVCLANPSHGRSGTEQYLQAPTGRCAPAQTGRRRTERDDRCAGPLAQGRRPWHVRGP